MMDIIQNFYDYAKQWDLHVVEGREAIIDALEIYPPEEETDSADYITDDDEMHVPMGLTHMAFFNSGNNQFSVAYIDNDELYHYDDETEEPDEGIKCTFDELNARGDPRDWMA